MRLVIQNQDILKAMNDISANDITLSETKGDDKPSFGRLLGIILTHVSPDRVEAKLEVRDELTNRNGTLHGGAIMALADDLGGTATFLNLPKGATTTTVESKTNFLAACPRGEIVRTETTPLHRGRTTMVWQTKITRSDGKLAAVVTQTQMVLAGKE